MNSKSLKELKEIPSLEGVYHRLLAIEKDLYYYCCPLDCWMCQEWNQLYQSWKTSVYFPFHCHICQEAGECDDFYLTGRIFLCRECRLKYLKRINQIISRGRLRKDYKYLLERKENQS